MILAIICGIITLITILVLIIRIKQEKLTTYTQKISQSETDIDALLTQKLSLLSAVYAALSEINDTEFNFLCHLDEESENEFKLNTILNKAYQEIKKYLSDHRNFIPNDETKVILEDLHQCDIECTATKEYYNDNVIKYNNIIKKFPNNIIAKLMHLATKELYNDPVEEEFEILKEKKAF